MSYHSQLEIFPDELFLELFSYISPEELYHVWIRLNRRFASIINSLKISMDLFDSSSQSINTLNYFAHQIVYINIRAFSPSLNFNSFPKLRTLIIDTQLNPRQLKLIRPWILPALKRITFPSQLPDVDSLNEILLIDQLNDSKTRWIEIYQLPRIPNYLVKNPSKFNHIHSVIFNRLTTPDVDLLLSSLIYLRYLKVTVVPKTMDQTRPPVKATDPNYHNRNLVNLNVTMNTCDKLDDFFPIMSRLPSLISLYIACDSLMLSDFQQLAVELHTRVPWLRRFNCTFQQTYVDDMMKLHQLSPYFRRMGCQKIEWPGGWHYYCVTTLPR